MIFRSKYKPPFWIVNRHLQTLWGPLIRRETKLECIREDLTLPDGDFIELVWSSNHSYGPIVLIVHGLGGSIESHYAQGNFNQLVNSGYNVVFCHFRGAGSKPNRFIHSYHIGETKDIDFVVNYLGKKFPNRKIYAVGFSLGANVLLKWLGETGRDNPLSAAIAISTPFNPHN